MFTMHEIQGPGTRCQGPGKARGEGIWRFAVAVAALAVAVPLAHAQRGYIDPVIGVQRALAENIDATSARDMQTRQKTVTEQIDRLRTVGEMQRALALQDWQDLSIAEPAIAKVDTAARQHLADRLRALLQRAMTSTNPSEVLAALTVVGEMSTIIRGVATTQSLAPIFLPDLLRLARHSNLIIRDAAAIALSKTAADPAAVTKLLSDMLHAPEASQRQVAARGLENMVEQVAELARGANTAGIRAGVGDVVDTGRLVLGVLEPGLRDPDPTVRRLCLETVDATARTFALADVLGATLAAETGATGRVGEERAAFVPLARALGRVTPTVAALTLDAVPLIRLDAARVIDQITFARVRLLRRPAGMPATAPGGEVSADRGKVILVAQRRPRRPQGPAPQPLPPSQSGEGRPQDPIGMALFDSLPDLERATRDPDPRVRQTVIDTFEWLGRTATPALPAMVRLLYDRNLFVRWQAARTVGKLNPQRAAPEALPGLERLLQSEDLDVRMAAAVALERYGTAAEPAVPALAAACERGDPDGRLAAMHALEAIGLAGVEAVPALISNLSHDDNRVRLTAAEALGRLGPAARAAVPALRNALADSDPDVRREAGDALLNILVAPPAGR